MTRIWSQVFLSKFAHPILITLNICHENLQLKKSTTKKKKFFDSNRGRWIVLVNFSRLSQGRFSFRVFSVPCKQKISRVPAWGSTQAPVLDFNESKEFLGSWRLSLLQFIETLKILSED